MTHTRLPPLPGAPLRPGAMLLSLMAALPGGPCFAAQDEAAAPVWWTVGDAPLAEMRGGFDLGRGLIVSFGITRAVYINNQQVTQTTLQLPDLGHLQGLPTDQAATLAQQIRAQVAAQLATQLAGQAKVIQNGPGNSVSPEVAVLPLGTYIQNTLNNQTIRTETLIQATSNGLGLLKSMNLHNAIQEAVNQAIGPR